MGECLRRMARLMLSYTEIVKQRLLKFVQEVKSGKYTPEQIAVRSQSVDDNLRHFLRTKESELAKSGDKLIPSQLVPKYLHGQQQVKNILKEASQLYKNFLVQAKNPGQHKFLEDTVNKLVQCFDAIQGAVR
jgi:ribosomal protein L16 Arg81 hydroxylase